MNYRMVLYVLGRIFLVEAALLVIPLACALLYGENTWLYFLIPIAALVLLGGALGAKLLGCDPFLGAVASIGLFYFFPGVQNIVTEVCRSCAEGEEEYAALYRHLAPPAIITAFMGSRFCLLLTALLLPVVLS